MIHVDFHSYPPGAVPKAEHPFWTHDDPVFLVALWCHLRTTFNSRYPEFKFVIRGKELFVQVHLDGKAQVFLPGHYGADFNRMIGESRGFEAGWSAASPPERS